VTEFRRRNFWSPRQPDNALGDRHEGALMFLQWVRLVVRLLSAISLVLVAASATAQVRPEQDAISLAPREVIDRLRADPIAYFRFVNRPWIARVCDMFADEIRDQPTVRLHGDAHVEQFTVTSQAWGLDDFDDSVKGPALVDIVRFLGSIELIARQRGWIVERDSLFDRFFSGYRKGLTEPEFQPPRPSVVDRLRVGQQPSRSEFLNWGETLMTPMADGPMKAVLSGMDAIARVVYAERPDIPPGYFAVVAAGWLRMGVGSATAPKILIRIQGASTAPDDDELVEAKQVQSLDGLQCLQLPTSSQVAYRVILGVLQLGRLRHEILVAGPALVIPEVAAEGQELRKWWIRSWDPSYRELRIDNLRSPRDLAQIAYDVGVQLGAGSLKELSGLQRKSERQRELASLARIERRIRNKTSQLVAELIAGWIEFMLSTRVRLELPNDSQRVD
jgi:hypothetical protein